MDQDKIQVIVVFLKEEIRYFKEKTENLTYEEYASNRDVNSG